MGYKQPNVGRIPEEVAEELAVERIRAGKRNDEIITEALAERYGIEWKDHWFNDEEDDGEE